MAPYAELTKARGLRWPVVKHPDGSWKETRYRFLEEYDPFVAKGKGVQFYHSVTKDDRALIGFILEQLYEPQQFIALVEKLYATQEISQDEILFKDGRVFSRRSVPFIDDDGAGCGRIWIFTDITAIRAAERDSLTGLFTRRKFSEIGRAHV